MLNARDLMTENPVAISPSEKVKQAIQILQAMDIRHLPVVNEDGELVGMLSDRDLRAVSIPYLMADEHIGQILTAREAPVSDLMSSDVLSVEAETQVSEIVELMLENKIGAVPVTRPDGTLIGIVSYMDVLRKLPFDDAD